MDTYEIGRDIERLTQRIDQIEGRDEASEDDSFVAHLDPADDLHEVLQAFTDMPEVESRITDDESIHANSHRVWHEKGRSGSDLNDNYWYDPGRSRDHWTCRTNLEVGEGTWTATWEFFIPSVPKISFPYQPAESRLSAHIIMKATAGQDRRTVLVDKIYNSSFISDNEQGRRNWHGEIAGTFNIPENGYNHCDFRLAIQGPMVSYKTIRKPRGGTVRIPKLDPIPCYPKRLVLKKT